MPPGTGMQLDPIMEKICETKTFRAPSALPPVTVALYTIAEMTVWHSRCARFSR